MFLLVEIVHRPLQSCSSQNASDKNIWKPVAKFSLSDIYIIMPNCHRAQERLTEVGYERNMSWNKLWFSVRVNTPCEAGEKLFCTLKGYNKWKQIPQQAPQICICAQSHTAAATPCSCVHCLRLGTKWTHIKQILNLVFPYVPWFTEIWTFHVSIQITCFDRNSIAIF